jgi:hypothetical protein
MPLTALCSPASQLRYYWSQYVALLLHGCYTQMWELCACHEVVDVDKEASAVKGFAVDQRCQIIIVGMCVASL